jgi:ankyrin repeat protein
MKHLLKYSNYIKEGNLFEEILRPDYTILELFDAIENDDPIECRKILSSGQVDIHEYGEDGLSVLNVVANLGYKKNGAEICKMLIDYGADVNEPNFDSALYFCAIKNNLPVARVLLENGALVDWQDEDGRTPLFFSVVHDHSEMAQYLIDKGASVSHTDFQKKTALHLAAENGSIDSMRVLLNNGAEIEAKNAYSDTPLLGAIWGGNLEAVKFLLQNGANPNTTIEDSLNIDNDCLSATKNLITLYPERQQYKEIAKELIRNGAKIFPAFKNRNEFLETFGDDSWVDPRIMRKFYRSMGMNDMFSKNRDQKN